MSVKDNLVLLKVTKAHQGEGSFPTFSIGTPVHHMIPCEKYPNWFSCDIVGHKTYVPNHFVVANRLIVDYNPTELVVTVGDQVAMLECHDQWALVDHDGQIGWLPVEILQKND
ncbi:hypothetical protein ACVRZR_01260 [Streptococcus entericus]|uniref:hypothetical protein n=1 Tax=Streptococcus entericus TaxID=155680 RepID=UPI00035E9788|nr:hypothetical protein [Streptococcus entericus]